MPSSSIRAQEQEEIGKATHDGAVIGRGASEVGPVLGEGETITPVYLKGVEELICFKAVGEHDYVGLDDAVLCF